VVENLMDDFPHAAIVSVDVPTPGVEADLTVTFTALKPSLVFDPACGDVILAEIGNPQELLESPKFKLELIQPNDVPARDNDTNKATYGKVLVIGGSRGKSGAAAMAGQAALRAGAGLVTVGTPASVLPIVAASMPELMTEALEETPEGTIANRAIPGILDGKTVLAIGPGIGTHPETIAFVRYVVESAKVPVVLDADGLAGFAANDSGVIITPHPGEMARLIQKDAAFVNANRLDVARDFATENNVYVVLKGFRTVVATPDGMAYINSSGNPGMATAGTGDILTGMIAGILAQTCLGDFVERLCLAVYLHGLAGDLAAEELGEQTMVATDLLRFLPKAWDEIRGQ
jgi:NAD(P)H-hydrate epimerase